jgi:signal transduction histidine kinase/HAMP domain-containing protein
MKNIKFSTKFALILSLTVLAAVGLVGWRLSVINLDALKGSSRDYYTIVARGVSARLEGQSADIARLLFQTAELLGATNQDGSAPLRLDMIKSSLSKAQYTNSIGIYDMSGAFIDAFSKPKGVPAQRVPQEMLDSLQNSPSAIGRPAWIGANGMPVIPIAVKWSDAEGHAGILMSLIDNETLCQFVAQSSAESFTGEREHIYLVSDSLRIIAHAIPAFVAANESLAGKGIFSEVSVGSQLTFTREVVEAKEYVAPPNTPTVGISSPVSSLRLAIIVEQPQSVVYRSVSEMRQNLLYSSLIVAAFAVIISIFGAQLISKPIAQLVDASEKLAEKDFSVRLDDVRGDEFGILFQTHNRVASELERYNSMNIGKIVSARNKLESVVQQASDGIIVVEPSRHILVLNNVFAHWFGVENARIDDTTTVDRLFTSMHLKHEIAKAFVSKETVIPVEFTLQLAGEVRETILRGTFVRVLYSNELIAVTGLLRDVTREVAVDRMKTELVSIVAHELRSPLNTMRGFSELIRKGDLERDENMEFAEIITTEADRLNGVITKFLDLNRIESGRTELQKAPFKLHELVQNVLRVNMPLAEPKRITIETDIPGNTTPIVGDAELIGQVVLNLFSNAVKYTEPNKRVKIEVQENQDNMYVAIHDEGYGISESAQEKLFSKFFRATDDERVRSNVGTGLGLAFIKEIIDKHDGQIGCKSQLNKGSTFWFTLPK